MRKVSHPLPSEQSNVLDVLSGSFRAEEAQFDTSDWKRPRCSYLVIQTLHLADIVGFKPGPGRNLGLSENGGRREFCKHLEMLQRIPLPFIFLEGSKGDESV